MPSSTAAATHGPATGGRTGFGAFRCTSALFVRNITQNTLADTPSGYTQDPRALWGPTEQERDYLSDRGRETLAEMAEQRELQYDGYATSRIQYCKALIMSSSSDAASVSPGKLRECVETLKKELQTLQALVGRAAPPPQEELSSSPQPDSTAHTAEAAERSYQVTLRQDGTEVFHFTAPTAAAAPGSHHPNGMPHSSSAELHQHQQRGAADDGAVVVSEEDVHHVRYLLCIALRRLGEYEASNQYAYDILRAHPWNVDAMESVMEVYVGLDSPERVREFLVFLEAQNAAVEAFANHTAALGGEELITSQREGGDASLKHPDQEQERVQCAVLPGAATPVELGVGVLADLIMEGAARRVAESGEGACARFYVEVLGSFFKHFTSRQLTMLVEALYRIHDDVFSAAKVVVSGGGSGSPSTLQRGLGLGETGIDSFLQKAQQHHADAKLRERGEVPAITSKKRGEDDDSSTGSSIPQLSQGDVAFLVVTAFHKVCLQRKLYELTNDCNDFQFVSRLRLYESLRLLSREHESYRIFDTLEAFVVEQGKVREAAAATTAPDGQGSNATEPTAVAAARTPSEGASGASSRSNRDRPLRVEREDEFASAYFLCLGDRILEEHSAAIAREEAAGGSGVRSSRAVQWCMKGMERFPASATPWVLLALLLHHDSASGEEGARDALLAAQRAVTMEPHHLEAVFTLAHLYKQTKGCYSLYQRMVERYELLKHLIVLGASDSDLAATLQEIRELAVEERHKNSSAEGHDDGNDEEECVDAALRTFYERLVASHTYSMPVDEAPRVFADPPQRSPANDANLDEERPELMRRPLYDNRD